MKITIDTHHCSREELVELKEYLEEKCWDFTTDEESSETQDEEPKYELREDGIYVREGSQMIILKDEICQEEMHEYSIIDRKDFINELYRWISEARDDNSKQIMIDDLDMLKELEDDYIFSSNSTNSYISKEDSKFEDICEELIVLNNSI